ncbi:MAG TPA: response regulator [Stellaceae bacterium]|nr:response regulator [Stellaceae bacterium]
MSGHCASEAPSVALGDLANAPISRRRFLFVDDNAFIASAIQRVAGACGVEVRATTSAAAFRERYLEQVPDLVGFDLAMPDGDGIELIRFLAGEGCRAPILIVTGHDRRVLASAARLGRERGLNIVETLSKPFSVESLRAALARMSEIIAVESRGQ